jgi:hypothetical protein
LMAGAFCAMLASTTCWRMKLSCPSCRRRARHRRSSEAFIGRHVYAQVNGELREQIRDDIRRAIDVVVGRLLRGVTSTHQDGLARGCSSAAG